MKAIITIFAGFAFVLSTAFTINESEPLKGESFTDFGNYKIQASEKPMIIGKKELKSYELVYGNVKQPVRIGVDEKRNCVSYIVKYPNFEVQYDCNRKGLGVRLLEGQYATVDSEVIQTIMDFEQFAYQQVIVPEQQNTEQSLHLIACYFPKLIREELRTMK